MKKHHYASNQRCVVKRFISSVLFGLACFSWSLTTTLASTTIILEDSAVADAHVQTDLDGRRNDNYGCEPHMSVGTSRGGGGIPWGGADAMRVLLRFDFSSLPGGPLSLTSATLRMRLWHAPFDNGTATSVYNVDVHRIVDSGPLTPWDEGNGTGYSMPGCTNVDDASGVAWVGDGDGGDPNNQTQPNFGSAVVASAQIFQATNVAGDVIEWDVTMLVRGWIDNTVPNFGMLLRDVTTDGSFRAVRFATREAKLLSPPSSLPGPQLVLSFVPVFNCAGFEPPMDKGPVIVKKKKALPLKAELLDQAGLPVTDVTVAGHPVIQVTFTPLGGGSPTDVTGDALPVGLGTEGNQFVFTEDKKWQFNLKTNNYSAPGTYLVEMVSGDYGEYAVMPTCTASFIIE